MQSRCWNIIVPWSFLDALGHLARDLDRGSRLPTHVAARPPLWHRCTKSVACPLNCRRTPPGQSCENFLIVSLSALASDQDSCASSAGRHGAVFPFHLVLWTGSGRAMLNRKQLFHIFQRLPSPRIISANNLALHFYPRHKWSPVLIQNNLGERSSGSEQCLKYQFSALKDAKK
jgi:hypothetical protein